MQFVISIIMAIVMFIAPSVNYPKAELNESEWNTNYSFVFVHGLGGWGEYDFYYDIFPYWGVFGGDMLKYLNARGINGVAPSLDPSGSAWDRACELYAQLTGTKVDYGKAHSERCEHDRFGRDYTGKALLDDFSAESKINLLGHSFGGATILVFTELMANGNDDELSAANDASELFKGGKADWIYSITTLAAPMNGTTAYSIGRDAEEGVEKLSPADKASSDLIGLVSLGSKNKRIAEDNADYDMFIDNAMALLDGIETLENVYYFSVPCCATVEDPNGGQTRDKSVKCEPLVLSSMETMGHYTGVTPGGVVLDESWQPNDGLVNTISARAPFNAPQRDFDGKDIESVTSGIWNVLPTYRGDHQALMGDLINVNYIRPFYIELLDMINRL